MSAKKETLYTIADTPDSMVLSLPEWQEYMDICNEDEYELIPMKREIGSLYFFCSKHGESIHKEPDVCGGDNCEYYTPRNGKRGICKFNLPNYVIDHSKGKVILKKKGKINYELYRYYTI
jgi:hypothetical protein